MQRHGRDRALAAGRRREALAAWQVAERAAGGEVAVIGDRGAPAQVEAHVGPARTSQARFAGVAEQLRDGLAARAHRVEVDAHEPRQEVGVDARHRRAARAALARPLARARVRERRQARRDEDIGGGEGGRHGGRRLGRMRPVGRQDHEHRVAARRACGVHERVAERGVAGSATISTFSPALTARQRSTTVRTACSRSPPKVSPR